MGPPCWSHAAQGGRGWPGIHPCLGLPAKPACGLSAGQCHGASRSPQRLYFLHPQNALCLMHIPGVLEGGYWTLRMHHCAKYGTVWSPRSHSAGVTKIPITSYHFPVHLSVFIVHLFQLESKFLGHEEVSFFTIKSL